MTQRQLYTQEEDSHIVREWSKRSAAEIGRALGRSPSSIKSRYLTLRRRGIPIPKKRIHRRFWREDEDEFLESNWGLVADKAVACALGRSVKACELRAYILCVTKTANRQSSRRRRRRRKQPVEAVSGTKQTSTE
jgi:hypothetical protein